MPEFADGKEVKQELLRELNETIKKNSKINTIQNVILIILTGVITWLTWDMAFK